MGSAGVLIHAKAALIQMSDGFASPEHLAAASSAVDVLVLHLQQRLCRHEEAFESCCFDQDSWSFCASSCCSYAALLTHQKTSLIAVVHFGQQRFAHVQQNYYFQCCPDALLLLLGCPSSGIRLNLKSCNAAVLAGCDL